mmetsp:Transcript_70016/g.121168  ORF Transcript_70016/g.121168 Transcript_70016/m.121168 type:complete len:391 (-) Transcript_70016:73-1245(-)
MAVTVLQIVALFVCLVAAHTLQLSQQRSSDASWSMTSEGAAGLVPGQAGGPRPHRRQGGRHPHRHPAIPGSSRVSSSSSHPREAVVVLSRGLENECAFQWLLALARSSSTDTWHRDVWFLHDKKRPVNQTQAKMLTNLNVHIDIQADVPSGGGWSSFHNVITFRSGFTKPSFLIFASSHSEYDFFWFIEDDAFFTGRWSDLFAAPYEQEFEQKFLPVANPDMSFKGPSIKGSADLVGIFNQEPMSWPWSKSTFLGHKFGESNSTSLKFLWPVARFSHTYVHALAEALSDGKVSGHHEAVAGNFCSASPWCTMEHLPVNSDGVWGAGYGPFQDFKPGFGKLSYVASWHHSFEPGHHFRDSQAPQLSSVYHPVKCAFSEDVGAQALAYAHLA